MPRFFVYRLYGHDGEIAYVGCTQNLWQRPNVSRVGVSAKKMDYCEVKSRERALNVEAFMIAKFKPRGNTQHPKRPTPRRVEELVFKWADRNVEGNFKPPPKPIRLTGQQVIEEMNAVEASKLPPVKTPQSFYNWRKKGFPGFYPAEPILDDTDKEAP